MIEQVLGLYGNGAKHKGEYNTVVIAAGEETAMECLGLTNGQIHTNPSTGKIYTDVNDQTNINNIYAIGDIVEGKALGTPAYVCAATYLVQRIFTTNKKKMMDYHMVPNSLLLPPSEYSYIGLTEEQAQETFPGQITIYKKCFKPIETVFSQQQDIYSFIKIICHFQSDKREKVIGLHIYGRNAGYTIQGFPIAMRKGLFFEELKKLIPTDLTNAEKLTHFESRYKKCFHPGKELTELTSPTIWQEELKKLHDVTEEPSQGDLKKEKPSETDKSIEILISFEQEAVLPTVSIPDIVTIEQKEIIKRSELARPSYLTFQEENITIP